jgi:23S rRNA (cytosine1962-C5)-methyltransferase
MPNRVREIILRQRGAASPLDRGHPWVWRDAVGEGLEGATFGEVVQVLVQRGSPVGQGLVDPRSPIAVRVWTHGNTPLNAALFRERIEAAAALRSRLFAGDGDTDAYRVLHGEGDRAPGFVIDRYAHVAVLRTDGEAAEARVHDVGQAAAEVLASRGVTSLVHRTGAKGQPPRLEVLAGGPPPETVHVREHGVSFVVDLAHGQKTGAFLDQRENRRFVGQMARGRRVLNLFSYAGGFSLHAAIGGAAHVTSVDVAAAAHATAQASFQASGLDPRKHAFVTADVRTFLDAAAGRKEKWDLVVSDPPSFAPNEKAVVRALAAYRALHRACASVLAPGGIFCAASCSSHVSEADFLSTLDDEALERSDLRVLESRGAGPDHPTLAAFPEGRYLKFVVLA